LAACSTCDREMTLAPSCRPRLGAILYGDERYDWPTDPPERCRDCNVTRGSTHHRPCCVELCGRCGGQLLTCGHDA
jgi:hypothetical protein